MAIISGTSKITKFCQYVIIWCFQGTIQYLCTMMIIIDGEPSASFVKFLRTKVARPDHTLAFNFGALRSYFKF